MKKALLSSSETNTNQQQFIENIANNLTFLRGDISLRKVCTDCEISYATLSRIENCLVSPNISTLIKLAHYYNVPLSFILN